MASFVYEKDLQAALDGLLQWTRQLVQATHFSPDGSMEDDGIGFNTADYPQAQDYLGLAEFTADDVPIGVHTSWAKRLAKYGDSQLGGRKQVQQFIRRLEREAEIRGEAVPKKIPKRQAKVEGADGAAYRINTEKRADGTVVARIDIIPPRSIREAPRWFARRVEDAGIAKDAFQWFEIANGEVRMRLYYVEQAPAILRRFGEVAGDNNRQTEAAAWLKLADRVEAIGTTAQRHFRAERALVQRPSDGKLRQATPELSRDHGPDAYVVAGREAGAFLVPGQAGVVFVALPFNQGFVRADPRRRWRAGAMHKYAADIEPKYTVLHQFPEHLSPLMVTRGAQEGNIVANAVRVSHLAALIKALQEEGLFPSMVQWLVSLQGRMGDADRAEVAAAEARAQEEARRAHDAVRDPSRAASAAALLDVMLPYADVVLRNSPEAQQHALQDYALYAPEVDAVPQFADSVDLGEGGRWEQAVYGGNKGVFVYGPKSIHRWPFEWYRFGIMTGTSGTRGNLKRYVNWIRHMGELTPFIPMKNVNVAAQALEAFGAYALAASLRKSFLDGLFLSEQDELLCMLSKVRKLDQITDPVMRKMVEDMGRRIEAQMEPGTKLRPYQKVTPAFWWLTSQKPGATGMRMLQGDAIGLGKTLQALAGLMIDVNLTTPALAVVPVSVVGQWAQEIEKFAARRLNPIPVYQPKDYPKKIGPSDVIIISTGRLYPDIENLLNYGFRTLILDESHLYKNSRAKRTKAATDIAHSVPNVMCMTGSAIKNRPVDLWSQLNIIDASLFSSKKKFIAQFDPKSAGGRFQTTVASTDPDEEEAADIALFLDDPEAAVEQLKAKLCTVMVARPKSEVLQDLPSLTTQTIPVALTPKQQREYDRVEREFVQDACTSFVIRMEMQAAAKVEQAIRAAMADSGAKRFPRKTLETMVSRAVPAAVAWANAERSDNMDNPLTKLVQLRQTTGRLKVPAALAFVESFMEQTKDSADIRPLIISAHHIGSVVTPLAQGIETLNKSDTFASDPITYAVIDGRMPGKKRDQVFASFQAGDIDVLVISSAIETGVNLQRSSDVVFLERKWTHSDEEQTFGRVWRSGQINPVTVYYLMADGTMDEYMGKLVSEKAQDAERILGGESRMLQGDVQSLVSSVLQPRWRRFAMAHADAWAHVLQSINAAQVGAGLVRSDSDAQRSVAAAIIQKAGGLRGCEVTPRGVAAAIVERGNIEKWVE